MLVIWLLTASLLGTGAGIIVTNITNSGVAGLIAGIIVWTAALTVGDR